MPQHQPDDANPEKLPDTRDATSAWAGPLPLGVLFIALIGIILTVFVVMFARGSG